MAAPEHVPTDPNVEVRSYGSPPRRPEQWRVTRPADFAGTSRQPSGALLGNQGPDQGYGLKLANQHLAGELVLQPGEHLSDALAGLVAVALKRASQYGRAPVIHDLRVAATIWGFFDETPDPELLALRGRMFEEVGHFHHYGELRHIADSIDEAVLGQLPAAVTAQHHADWRSQITAA